MHKAIFSSAGTQSRLFEWRRLDPDRATRMFSKYSLLCDSVHCPLSCIPRAPPLDPGPCGELSPAGGLSPLPGGLSCVRALGRAIQSRAAWCLRTPQRCAGGDPSPSPHPAPLPPISPRRQEKPRRHDFTSWTAPVADASVRRGQQVCGIRQQTLPGRFTPRHIPGHVPIVLKIGVIAGVVVSEPTAREGGFAPQPLLESCAPRTL